MKKEWQKPKILKVQLKQATLNGSGSSVEQNAGQGATSKRPNP